jgi:hypothetical protein
MAQALPRLARIVVDSLLFVPDAGTPATPGNSPA